MEKKVIKKAAVIMVLLMSSLTLAGSASVIMNDSFENDGVINNITTGDHPQRWDDVNFPLDLFGGEVWTGWPLIDGNSLMLYSYSWVTFNTGDIATISQQVYIDDDVNHIYFSLKLDTDFGPDFWDESKRTAVLLIDDTEVWSSDELTPNVSGEYFVDVNETIIAAFKDQNLHKLSLGLRSEETAMPTLSYYAQWDYIRFDAYCEGFGYVWLGDIDRDCYVDFNDLKLLAHEWLGPPPTELYDLYEDNNVDFLDFTVLLGNWRQNSYSYAQEYGLLEYDLNNDGIVNFLDYVILAADWSEGNYGEIKEMVNQWLDISWLYWAN